MKRLALLTLVLSALSAVDSFAAFTVVNKTGKPVEISLYNKQWSTISNKSKGNYAIDMDGAQDDQKGLTRRLDVNKSTTYEWDDQGDIRNNLIPETIMVKFAGDSDFTKAKKDNEAAAGTDQTYILTIVNDFPHFSFDGGSDLGTIGKVTKSQS